ncbi:hypothetical protein P7C71_g6502, partial [Lecanoromycetidae sp. Uapishka_2]
AASPEASASSSTSTTANHATAAFLPENHHNAQTLVRDNLAGLQAAYEDQVVHIVGKEQMRIGDVKDAKGWVRRIALAAFLWLRSNTGSKVANMNLDVEKLVEVGFVKVI